MNLKSVNAIATAGLVLPAGASGQGKAGKNCTIQSIQKISGATRITFAWTSDTGSVTTSVADIPDGKSAYDVAVENGYQGTEAEWTESFNRLLDGVKWDDITDKPTDFVQDASYVHTDNNFSDDEKAKLGGLANIKSVGKGLTLGSAGDLTADDVSPEAFIATYGTTTAQQIIAHIDASNEPFAPILVNRNSNYYTVTHAAKLADNRVSLQTFASLSGEYYIFNYTITNGSWSNSNYGFQKKLVSGTDIKTVNGESLLGGGNLQVSTTVGWNDITNKPDVAMQSSVDALEAVVNGLDNVEPVDISVVEGWFA